jgi:hypothetical protein
MALEDVYYDHIYISRKGGNKVWRIDGKVIPDNPTQEDLDSHLARVAKKLLKG